MDLMIEIVMPALMIICANATNLRSIAARTGITVSAAPIVRRDRLARKAQSVPEARWVRRAFPEQEVRWVPKVLRE